MADLEEIADMLRRQRRDLEQLMDSTSSRSSQTADLVQKIEDLRRRCDDTRRRFEASVEAKSKSKSKSK